jgi:hypothetical protein
MELRAASARSRLFATSEDQYHGLAVVESNL